MDPWDVDFGASVELDSDATAPVGLQLDVETGGAWRPVPPADAADPCCAFIDGVRRIDVRLFAEAGDVQAPALAGSWAVGCALATRPPRVDSVVVGRELVVGAGLLGDGLDVTVGSARLYYRPSSVPGTEILDPLRGLQNAMRDAESRAARAALAEGRADLVVADGPLGYTMPGPLLGMVKRQSRTYLDGERAGLLPSLRPGERTPMFGLGSGGRERYSWYLRLAPGRVIDGALTGIVRLEVDAAAGLETARELAGLAGAVLPRFAARPGHDARAPQNVIPVGALEAHLRHRLGDAMLVRRALEARLMEEAGHA